MSGKRVTFVGDAMAAVVQGVEEVRVLTGQPPVVVGGLPSDDPGDRLHAFALSWASDSATTVTIEVAPLSGVHVEVSALVAEPGGSDRTC